MPSGKQNYNITTHWRQKSIARLARKSFRSFSSSVTSSSTTSGAILRQISSTIKKEMKFISSDDHNSLLRDSNDGIKHFKWDRLFGELSHYMPTCVSLLLSLISGKDDSRTVMLVCVIISMLLKKRLPKMGLLQRAISVLLYGNGCSRQVCLLII